jgi:hypothetical protein
VKYCRLIYMNRSRIFGLLKKNWLMRIVTINGLGALSLKRFRLNPMLTFLLPNSIFFSRTTARGSQGLRSLTRRQERTRPAKASTSRSFADNAEDYAEGAGSIESNRKQGEHVRWLLTQGQQYRRPNENGPNWLGGSVVSVIQPIS